MITTIADTERIIRKIEACEGMAAKLVLMRQFGDSYNNEQNEQLEQQVFHLKELVDHYRERERQATELLARPPDCDCYARHDSGCEAITDAWYKQRDQWLRDAGMKK